MRCASGAAGAGRLRRRLSPSRRPSPPRAPARSYSIVGGGGSAGPRWGADRQGTDSVGRRGGEGRAVNRCVRGPQGALRGPGACDARSAVIRDCDKFHLQSAHGPRTAARRRARAAARRTHDTDTRPQNGIKETTQNDTRGTDHTHNTPNSVPSHPDAIWPCRPRSRPRAVLSASLSAAAFAPPPRRSRAAPPGARARCSDLAVERHAEALHTHAPVGVELLGSLEGLVDLRV